MVPSVLIAYTLFVSAKETKNLWIKLMSLLTVIFRGIYRCFSIQKVAVVFSFENINSAVFHPHMIISKHIIYQQHFKF